MVWNNIKTINYEFGIEEREYLRWIQIIEIKTQSCVQTENNIRGRAQLEDVRFKVFTTVRIKVAVFRDIAPCNLEDTPT